MRKENESDCIEFLELPKPVSEKLRQMGLISPTGEIDQSFMGVAILTHLLGLTILEPDLDALAPFFERLDCSATGGQDLIQEVTRICRRLQETDPRIADLLIDLVERKLQRIQETAAVAFKEVRERFLREPTLGPKGGESVH